MTQTLKQGDRGALVSLLQLGLQRAGTDARARSTASSAHRRRRPCARFRRRTPSRRTASRARGRTAHCCRTTPASSRAPSARATRFPPSRGSTARAWTPSRSPIPTSTPSACRSARALTIPLPFSVTPADIPYSSALIGYVVRGLAARYPMLAVGEFGRSVLGRPLWYLTLGSGPKLVFYNAAHHANEWITTPLLLTFCEQLCARLGDGGDMEGQNIHDLLSRVTLVLAPAVDPDGIDLVTGALDAETTAAAKALAENYPDIPFPSGWKANIRGIDLNLQYPAGWSTAREIKFAAGYTRPGPRDYVGPAPLVAPESLAMYGFTRALDPLLTLSYHTQGRVIYWQYDGYDVPGSEAIARQFAAVSGYDVAATPYAAGHAGYKDWFIQDYRRPGFTIEAGSGENPLPLSQFPDIWSDNLGILLGGMTAVL